MAADYSTDPTIKDSTYNQKNGRYTMGGVTEVSSTFLEWWERNDMSYDRTDTAYVLEAKYVGRPDLLAYTFYGDTRLKWVIMEYNNILDPDAELVAGKMLLLPSAAQLAAQFPALNIGGVPTTAVGSV